MKKLFAILAVMGVLSFGMTQKLWLRTQQLLQRNK